MVHELGLWLGLLHMIDLTAPDRDPYSLFSIFSYSPISNCRILGTWGGYSCLVLVPYKFKSKRLSCSMDSIQTHQLQGRSHARTQLLLISYSIVVLAKAEGIPGSWKEGGEEDQRTHDPVRKQLRESLVVQIVRSCTIVRKLYELRAASGPRKKRKKVRRKKGNRQRRRDFPIAIGNYALNIIVLVSLPSLDLLPLPLPSFSLSASVVLSGRQVSVGVA